MKHLFYAAILGIAPCAFAQSDFIDLPEDLSAYQPDTFKSSEVPPTIKDTLFKLGSVLSSKLPTQVDASKGLTSIQVAGITFSAAPEDRKVIFAGGFVKRVGERIPRKLYPGPGSAEITAIERKLVEDGSGKRLVAYSLRVHIETPLIIEGVVSGTSRDDIDIPVFLREVFPEE